ncbi:hypothetical protein PC117_g8780 [Phytophthora cactorum]|uniref:Uncharacterized protein n=1 Tax=Phytophthora cactorum TaxID=29920 RepID=A0A8T1DU50_9STRA|nr:hypothetical protein PC117_g8780 [Phytophthora cactorum]
MAGKRKKTHWAVRRKNKQARREGSDEQQQDKETQPDRRADRSDAVHPGSYAAQRQRSETPAADAPSLPTKRRYGLWVAFCGKNYSGMQMNEGVKTIEAELERALFEAGGIAESNYGYLQKIGWSRAARTDKGVHAAGQLLTAKLHVGDDIAAFIAKVNAALPEDIRVMHMVTVTKNFNAKMSCDQRTYEYLAPTFIFGKRARPSTSSKNEEKQAEDNTTLEAHKAFRLSDETLEQLNATLKQYVGTHNFHNFTSKMEPTNPQANRFIISFEAERPFVQNDMEWVRLCVVGQSFLLHHIRKMIGTAVEIVSGVTDPSTIERAMELTKMDLPKAPSVGLYLAQAHFEVYNMKMEDSIQTSHPPLDLKEPSVAAAVELFKRDFIFDHIMKHEERTRTYAKWLRTMEVLPFDYVAKPYLEWKKEKEEEALRTNRAGRRESAKAARAEIAVQVPDISACSSARLLTEFNCCVCCALDLVIEREAKRRSALHSSRLFNVQAHFPSFSRPKANKAQRSQRSRRSSLSVAPTPEEDTIVTSARGSSSHTPVPDLVKDASTRQSSKVASELQAEDADEPVGCMQKIWVFFEDPQSSTPAYYFSLGIYGFIIISTFVFVAQTEAVFDPKVAFLQDFSNWVDFAAVFPFYMESLLAVDNAGSFGAIRIVRLTRVARVLKMSRYSSAIQVFTQAISISIKPLTMLIFLMSIAMIIFSSAIYFAEYTNDGCRADGWLGNCTVDSSGYVNTTEVAYSVSVAAAVASVSAKDACVCVDPNPYQGIATSFWWCIVTMSTVGYGDMTPVTWFGKVVGCCTVLTGMLVLALPITVIGTNFQKVMKSVMHETMKSNVDYLKGKRMLCRNEIEAILERFHAVTEGIHLDIDDVINVYDTDNSGMLEDDELAKFRNDLEVLQNRAFMNQLVVPTVGLHRSPSISTRRRGSATSTELLLQSKVIRTNSMGHHRLSLSAVQGPFATAVSSVAPDTRSNDPIAVFESPPQNGPSADTLNSQQNLSASNSTSHLIMPDNELLLRLLDMQESFQERLIETEQRLEAKMNNLTKILMRLEGMMELDD